MEELKDIIVGLEQRIKAYRSRLQELEKKRESLSDQVATIKRYLELAETLYRVEVDKAKLASLSSQLMADSDSPNGSPVTPMADVADQSRDILLGRTRFVGMSIPEATFHILSESNKSMHVKEIYQHLVEGGIHIRGKTPVTSIATALKRDKRFRKVMPNTFELEDTVVS